MTAPLRIAIADDEPELLEDLKELLEELGHEVVVVAYNGDDLIARWRQTQPQLLITDIKMEGMDGLEAIENITYHHPVPVIVVSAFYSDDFVQSGANRGVCAYLPKPLSEAALADAIENVMRRFRHRQTIRETAQLGRTHSI